MDSNIATCKREQFYYTWMTQDLDETKKISKISFEDVLTEARSKIITEPFRHIFTISETFPMRYCMTVYLKGYQKYDKSWLIVFIKKI